MDELNRRLSFFYEEYSKHVAVSRQQLAQDIAAKGQLGQGIANARTSRLEHQFIYEKFHGYESVRKDFTGQTFRKGIIGICMDYYSVHPEELTDETLRKLVDRFEEGKQRYIQQEKASNQRGYSERSQQIAIAETIRMIESIWSKGIYTLVQALKEEKDRIEYSMRNSKVNSTVNIAKNNGVVVIGDNNSINVQFAEVIQVFNDLQKKISKDERLSNDEKNDIAAEIKSLKAQLEKTKPDKSRIIQAWECIQTIVTGKDLYDLLAVVTPTIQSLLKSLF